MSMSIGMARESENAAGVIIMITVLEHLKRYKAQARHMENIYMKISVGVGGESFIRL